MEFRERAVEDSINLAIDQSIQAESGTWYRNLQVLGRGGNAATFLGMIADVINQMLKIDPAARPGAAKLLSAGRASSVKPSRLHALEGRAM